MRVFSGFEGLPVFRNAVVTVGSYDGVHRGHRVLLDTVMRLARERDGESVVVTFSPHPREVLDPQGVRLLNTLPEKIELLDAVGIDNLIVVSFDREFSKVPYDVFISEYLVGRIGMKVYVSGYNHHFGAGKQGGPASMSDMALKLGFEYYRVPRCDVGSSKVSSTVIRGYVERGDIAAASRLLGYDYFLLGCLNDGHAVRAGSALKLLPPPDIYHVRVRMGGRAFKGTATVRNNGDVRLCEPIMHSVSSAASSGEQLKVEFV